jgi:hypothetical protein
VSRYDVFRRRIAPIAFFAAIGVMAYQSCHRHERPRATIVLDLGAAEADVHAIDAELWADGEQVGVFHHAEITGLKVAPRFDVVLPARDAEVRFDVELGDRHRRFTRHIRADDGATITIPLERDLR